MASKQEQQNRKPTEGAEARGKVEEGLPMKDSPYMQYEDLEDYKRQAYGTQGHQQVQPGRGAGSTEGPTVSGATITSQGMMDDVDSMPVYVNVTEIKLTEQIYSKMKCSSKAKFYLSVPPSAQTPAPTD
ncbi:unnamed protein product [Malus baccata var. baccata]